MSRALSDEPNSLARDIEFALGLDTDGNGEITWGEVRTRHADIDAWAIGWLKYLRSVARARRG